MKLAPLLAQFLFSNKRLDLPGIGVFTLDGPLPVETDSKTPRNPGIRFENDQTVKDSPDLIQYISSQTGKIKALATADLESHLGTIQQFLNIGKPFLLEGIGSLVKIRSGEYAFSSGEILSEKFNSYTAKELSATSHTEESFSNYRKGGNNLSAKMNWRKPAMILLIMAGIALAVWGGYTVYKRTTSKNRTTKSEDPVQKDETVLVPDTAVTKKDSLTQTTQSTAGYYRFVLETANAQRAFTRFGTLKKYFWDVRMETKDSVSYKLYMLLPASTSDTARIVDSLSRLNGKRVYIE